MKDCLKVKANITHFLYCHSYFFLSWIGWREVFTSERKLERGLIGNVYWRTTIRLMPLDKTLCFPKVRVCQNSQFLHPYFIQSSSLLSFASHKSDVVFENTVPWHRGRDNDSSSIFQWAEKQQQSQESHLMEEESATVISFILGKST